MMIEKSGTIRLKDIHIPQGGTPEQQELVFKRVAQFLK